MLERAPDGDWYFAAWAPNGAAAQSAFPFAPGDPEKLMAETERRSYGQIDLHYCDECGELREPNGCTGKKHVFFVHKEAAANDDYLKCLSNHLWNLDSDRFGVLVACCENHEKEKGYCERLNRLVQVGVLKQRDWHGVYLLPHCGGGENVHCPWRVDRDLVLPGEGRLPPAPLLSVALLVAHEIIGVTNSISLQDNLPAILQLAALILYASEGRADIETVRYVINKNPDDIDTSLSLLSSMKRFSDELSSSSWHSVVQPFNDGTATIPYGGRDTYEFFLASLTSRLSEIGEPMDPVRIRRELRRISHCLETLDDFRVTVNNYCGGKWSSRIRREDVWNAAIAFMTSSENQLGEAFVEFALSRVRGGDLNWKRLLKHLSFSLVLSRHVPVGFSNDRVALAQIAQTVADDQDDVNETFSDMICNLSTERAQNAKNAYNEWLRGEGDQI